MCEHCYHFMLGLIVMLKFFYMQCWYCFYINRLWETWSWAQPGNGKAVCGFGHWGTKITRGRRRGTFTSHECHTCRSEKISFSVPDRGREMQCCHRDLWGGPRKIGGIADEGEEDHCSMGTAGAPTRLARSVENRCTSCLLVYNWLKN